MRVTKHSGRKNAKGRYSPKHNDRNYDYENASNIYAEWTPYNIYYNCYDGSYQHKDRDDKMTFEETETKYYEEHFKKQWEAINAKYIKQYHSERCKTFEEWSTMDYNLPEEIYFQIGNTEKHCDKNTTLEVYNMFNSRLNAWNKEHNHPFTILDMSFQVDEAVPQVHTRLVWSYINDSGIECIGQEEALKRAGVELPKPNKKKDQHNNRKMTFDKMTREMLLQCCKECGLEIETEPIPNARHNMSKDETIAVKFAEYQRKLDKMAEEQSETAKKQAETAWKQAETDKKQSETAKKQAEKATELAKIENNLTSREIRLNYKKANLRLLWLQRGKS
jgi:hypothetical protein